MEVDYDSKNSCTMNGHYCDKSQYGELGIWENLKMQSHLLLCKPCREYRKKNKQLTHAIQKSGIVALTPQEREMLKNRLRENTVQ